ncbi:antibiotic biosynthesis monooxygenase family protein [Corynebacterium guangdongense]|uniref:Heme-degrading monooxygenase HmoA n=1 Tax=Corynebacterium guangdongense TaxID=1783348 RepID=A0ABU1ZX71_9CORY|nr:antibiotic biosynthesis monooxygenase [Corynebacterium guangdongense]MDR7328812.1 heme-degrading monooxygenase HmoA [Corynebacterium guangdongense]WJZ17387.1 Heme-degrading monooxygenase HmoB [Corynebacterium guangdongense]
MSIVKINAITVPEGAGTTLEERFQARKHAIDAQPGFEGFQLLRPVKGEERYFVVTRWADQESYDAWWQGQGQGAHAQKDGDAPRKPVSDKAELMEFEVVLDSTEQ